MKRKVNMYIVSVLNGCREKWNWATVKCQTQLFCFESHRTNCGRFILLRVETVCLPQDVFSLLEPPESISSGCNVLSLAVLGGCLCVSVCMCLCMIWFSSVWEKCGRFYMALGFVAAVLSSGELRHNLLQPMQQKKEALLISLFPTIREYTTLKACATSVFRIFPAPQTNCRS